MTDPGADTLDLLFSAMGIDARWSVRQANWFAWWPHRFAQRVWAEPIERVGVRVHAEVDVLREVPEREELPACLAALNRFASLSALVHDPETAHVRYECAVTIEGRDSEALKRLFLSALAIQVADAHLKADALAALLGGEPDASEHPTAGAREVPDEMLEIIETGHAPLGRKESPFTAAEFGAARAADLQPWTAVHGQGAHLDAVFRAHPAALPSALFLASGVARHPQLGAGALLRVSLPAAGHPGIEKVPANLLNIAETEQLTHGCFLGAWCSDPHEDLGLTFVTFLPAAVYHAGFLPTLMRDMAKRAKWATGYLRRSTDEFFTEIRVVVSQTRNAAHGRPSAPGVGGTATGPPRPRTDRGNGPSGPARAR